MARRYRQTTLDGYVLLEPRLGEDVAAGISSYVSVDENVGALEPSEWEEEVCGCVQVCSKKCRNRLRRIECSPVTCSKQGECFNRQWALYGLTRAELGIRSAGEKGLGVFALEMIEKTSLVREYVGEIIDGEEKQRRDGKLPSVYVMAYGSKKIIDAAHVGNVSRFFNHSCSPNCVAEEWTVNGKYRIGIVADQRIFPGEEITFNYGNHFDLNGCKCEICGVK